MLLTTSHHYGMDLPHFHKLRTGVQSNAYPGSGKDLTTVEGDLRGLLMSSGIFEQVEVEHTDDADRLVIALCRYRSAYSEQDIAAHVVQLWQDRVRYRFWEAHSLIVDEGHVEFEAATRESSTGAYVTVHLLAQRARIPTQRAAAD